MKTLWMRENWVMMGLRGNKDKSISNYYRLEAKVGITLAFD